MNEIEKKIKELGWNIFVRIDRHTEESWFVWFGDEYPYDDNDNPNNAIVIEEFPTERECYNWIADKFNLMSLIRKDEVNLTDLMRIRMTDLNLVSKDEVKHKLDILITEKSFNLVDEESNMPDEYVIHIDDLELFEDD